MALTLVSFFTIKKNTICSLLRRICRNTRTHLKQWLVLHIISHLHLNFTWSKSCWGCSESWPWPAPAACLRSLCRPRWRRCSWARRWTSSWQWDPERSWWWGWCCNSWTWWKAPGSCHRTLRCRSPWSLQTFCKRTESRVHVHEKMLQLECLVSCLFRKM